MSFLITSTINALPETVCANFNCEHKFINFKQSVESGWGLSARTETSPKWIEWKRTNIWFSFAFWNANAKLCNFECICNRLGARCHMYSYCTATVSTSQMSRHLVGQRLWKTHTIFVIHFINVRRRFAWRNYCATKFIAQKHVWLSHTPKNKKWTNERTNSFRHHLMSWFIFST